MALGPNSRNRVLEAVAALDAAILATPSGAVVVRGGPLTTQEAEAVRGMYLLAGWPRVTFRQVPAGSNEDDIEFNLLGT
jgi:hypothetical protein